MTIHEKLVRLQTDFKAAKSRYNTFGKYNYRSAEDILEAVKPFLKELGCTIVLTEEYVEVCVSENINRLYKVESEFQSETQTEKNTPVIIMKSVATFSDGENAIHATALVGVDLEQKGMQTPQAFGSASSYGKKYSLGNLLLIDDTQDPDSTNTHGNDKVDKAKKAVASKDKEKMITASAAWLAAVKHVKAGNPISNIENKYTLDDIQRKSLLEHASKK